MHMPMSGIKEFKRLKAIAKKTQCKIKLSTRRGLPFILDRYRKRKIFFLFLGLVMCLIYIESKYVWNIDINGLDRIPEEEILAELAENGLSVGTKKSKIVPKAIINSIRLKRDDIAWMNIDLRGTNIIVEIAETTEKPDIIPLDENCNIVAKKDAEIVKITANSGTALVKVRWYCKKRKRYNWTDGWRENIQEQDMYMQDGEIIRKSFL